MAGQKAGRQQRYGPAGEERDERRDPSTAPAIQPPRWSGRKTAVAAVLAIGFATAGTAVAAAVPTGTGSGESGRGSPENP